jgi:hypothetical protein
MALYAHLLGKRVAAYYRVGDIYLPATAKLVADTGKSVFLEEIVSQQGRIRVFRWEIPYISLVQIAACGETPSPEKLRASPAGDSASAGPLSVLTLKHLLGEV